MPMEDQISPGSVATGQMCTLDWSQNILEPRKLRWKLAARDAPVTPQHSVKSVVKAAGKPTPEPTASAKAKPWVKPALELTSRGVGHGQVIAEKLQQIANMGPAATSRFTGDERDHKKKPESKKPIFRLRQRGRPADAAKSIEIGLPTTKMKASESVTTPSGDGLTGMIQRSDLSGSSNRITTST